MDVPLIESLTPLSEVISVIINWEPWKDLKVEHNRFQNWIVLHKIELIDQMEYEGIPFQSELFYFLLPVVHTHDPFESC